MMVFFDDAMDDLFTKVKGPITCRPAEAHPQPHCVQRGPSTTGSTLKPSTGQGTKRHKSQEGECTIDKLHSKLASLEATAHAPRCRGEVGRAFQRQVLGAGGQKSVSRGPRPLPASQHTAATKAATTCTERQLNNNHEDGREEPMSPRRHCIMPVETLRRVLHDLQPEDNVLPVHKLLSSIKIKPPTAVVQAAYPPRSPQPQSETSIMFFPALTTSPGSSVDLDSGSIHGGFTVSHYEESDGTPDTPTYLKTLSSGFPSTFALSKGVLWWYDTNAYNGESRIASGTLDQEAAATIAVSTVASLPLQPLLKAGNNKPSSAAKKLRKALRKAEKQEQQKLSVSEIVTSCHSISADDSLAAATCPHKETLPTNLAHFSVADNPLLLTTQDEGPDLAKALKAVSPTGHPAALPAVSPLARLRKNAESKNDANLERPAVTELPAPTGSTPAGAPEDESSCVLHCNPLFQAQEAMPMFTPIALTVDSSAEGPTTDDCGVEACKALRGKTTPLKPGRSGRTATMSPKHSRSLHRHVSLHVRTVSSASYTTFCGSEGRGPCSGASTGRACQVEQRTYTHVSSIGSNGGQPSSTGPASQDQGAIAPPMSADSETFGTPKGHCMPSVIQGTPLVWRTLSRRCSGGATAELHCKQQDNKTGKRKSSRSCRFRSASVPMAECEPRAAKSSVLEPRGTKKTTTRVHRDSKFAPPVLEEAAMPANAPLLPSRASLGGRVPEATSRSSVVSGTEKWIEDDDSLQIHGTKPGKHPRWTVTGFMQIVADRCVRTAQKFCKPFRSKRGDPEGKFSRLDGLP